MTVPRGGIRRTKGRCRIKMRGRGAGGVGSLLRRTRNRLRGQKGQEQRREARTRFWMVSPIGNEANRTMQGEYTAHTAHCFKGQHSQCGNCRLCLCLCWPHTPWSHLHRLAALAATTRVKQQANAQSDIFASRECANATDQPVQYPSSKAARQAAFEFTQRRYPLIYLGGQARLHTTDANKGPVDVHQIHDH